MTSVLTRAYWNAYKRLLVENEVRRSTEAHLNRRDSHARANPSRTEDLIRQTIARRQSAPAGASQLRTVDPNAPHDELVSEWLAVPHMTREDLRNAEPTLERTRGSTLVRTGGSTGEPVGVIVSKEGLKGKRARLLAARTAIGWRPGMPTFCLWGSERDIGNTESVLLRTQRRAAGLHFDAGFTTSTDRWHRLADAMEKKKDGIALYGYSTLLAEFATTLQADGRQLRSGLIASLWNGAEPVDAKALPALEFVTGRKLHDFYGARETGAIAVQLHREDAPGLTVVGPQILLEVVDENGSHAEPGETGKVLVSVLVPSGTPILRYEIGDFARAGVRMPFGHNSITELVGRTNDSIPLPRGGSVYGVFFNHLIKEFPSVAQFQALVDTTTLHINLRVVPSRSTIVDADLESLRAMVSSSVPGYDAEVTMVSDLERTAHGKLRQVIVK